MSTRPRRLPLAVALATSVLAGCSTGTHDRATAATAPANGASPSPAASAAPSATAARSASPTSTAVRSSAAAGESATTVAARFAQAYARYLDGRLAAGALPDVTSTARAQAGPAIPPGDRAGTLSVASLRPLAGGRTFALELRDRAHAYAAQLTATPAGASWRIVGVQAPDLDSVLHAGSGQVRQPSGSAPPARVAREFMRGYLPWLYGHGRASAIHGATAALTARLSAHPPDVPPSLQGLRARLAALGMQRRAGRWQALANVTDGPQTYTLTLTVARRGGGWRVSDVSYPH